MTTHPELFALDDGLADDGRVDTVDRPVGLAERRRVAVAEAVAEAVTEITTEGRRGAVGVRRYGPGCVALALRGQVDGSVRDDLRALAGDLPRAARRELVLDLAGVDRCDASLARTLGRLRIRCLLRGARVELHDPPAALAAELGIPGRGGPTGT